MEMADDQLISEFTIEALEGLANIEQQMLSIEAGGADVDLDLVNAVFRTMHSIKGTAGFLGLESIGTLAHALEEVLNRLRNREIVPTSAMVTTVLHAADFMKGLIEAVETSNDADVSSYVESLQQFRPGAEPVAEPASPAAAVDPPVEMPAVALPCAGSLSEAAREFVIECYENLDQMDHELLALEQDSTSANLLRSVFRTMHTIKGGAGFLGLGAIERLAHAAENLLGKLRDGAITWTPTLATALLATVDKCREGLRTVEATGGDAGFDPESVIQQLLTADSIPAEEATEKETTPASNNMAVAPSPPVKSPISASAPSVETPAPAKAVATPAALPKAASAANEGQPADKNNTSASDSTIRVDVALLDKLMTRVGELVLARNQILQRTSQLDDAEFTSTAQRLNLITTELQEGVMKTRMQPIGNVWAKFPRVVRDLSPQLGKQVRIEMEGKETELDKTIIESIKDPLTHLVRNSVDHGIETPDVRLAAGKPAEGCLTLRAYHEGGLVIIEICDDGAGLNFERIRKKAIERGLVSAESAARMTEREASQLILLPGFSTAEQVTAVSGRGVGMDVVKTNIERIGGTLDLQSQAGHGTTVKIKIPLTLAIIPALVVTCGGDRYAIPQVSLLELVRLEGEQARTRIEQIQGAPVYRLRGQLLPIVYLRDQLGLERSEKTGADRVLNIVVLRAEDRQFGLVVDTINDTEEIVVKPLSKQLKGIPTYAGTTIMGDGKVALILDVLGTAKSAHVVNEHRDRAVAEHVEDKEEQGVNRQTMLLLAIGDRQIAMPISLVARLEEIPRDKVEKSDHREVVQYRGQIMQLVRLGELLGIPMQEDLSQPLQVVVYSEGDFNIGFVVDRVADIADADITTTHDCESNELLYSAVIQQRVTDLLNLQSILRRVAPAVFSAQSNEQQLAV